MNSLTAVSIAMALLSLWLGWKARTFLKLLPPPSIMARKLVDCVSISLNVYEAMRKLFPDVNEESAAICALFHDVCKTNYYKVSTRNVKNDVTGQWEKVPFYQVADQFPFGHGEKSVYLIERYMRLTTEEAIAIRWHMGGFDEAVRGGSYAISNAYNSYPLAVKLHLADMYASYLMGE